jgi:8-oxo-dGTP pyrophosphatase MutT (NUDIX family)
VTDKSKLETWLRSGDGEESVIIPAATVVLVRETSGSLEALMLKKNSKLAFGGMWVFPGGRIDDADREGAPDIETAAKRAAVREAAEEAGLVVDEGSLAWIAHWLPPALAPKRFATYFFVAPAPAGAVTIDGGEIHDEAWMRPADALTRRDALEIELAPPTWVTLHDMVAFDTVDALMADAHAREPVFYETHMGKGEAGMFALWEGDAAYESGDADAPGPRHRLLMTRDGTWTLER